MLKEIYADAAINQNFESLKINNKIICLDLNPEIDI